jgi:hypothetical protein
VLQGHRQRGPSFAEAPEAQRERERSDKSCSVHSVPRSACAAAWQSLAGLLWEPAAHRRAEVAELGPTWAQNRPQALEGLTATSRKNRKVVGAVL